MCEGDYAFTACLILVSIIVPKAAQLFWVEMGSRFVTSHSFPLKKSPPTFCAQKLM